MSLVLLRPFLILLNSLPDTSHVLELPEYSVFFLRLNRIKSVALELHGQILCESVSMLNNLQRCHS